MKKFLTKTTALTTGIIFSILASISDISASWWDPGVQEDHVGSGLKPTWELTIPQMVENVLVFILSFLALIAVVIFIIAWFMIMTAWGDEDKVKKGKTWMINAIIWLIIIFIARSIVEWIFSFIK